MKKKLFVSVAAAVLLRLVVLSGGGAVLADWVRSAEAFFTDRAEPAAAETAAPEPSASFAAQLLENVDFEYCDDDVEAPDGEYFVIEFPNDMMSIDVFKGGDYIREEYDGFQMLLKVTGPTEGYFVDVMNQWNQALQKAGG